jgi:hypothetical protein
MTIDSSWIASFKEETPEAFTDSVPFRVTAAFCDGQIRLMRGNTSELITWDDYIWQQFHSHVLKFFKNHRVTTVILAFDDYTHVPEAKSMTQIKRRKHLPKLDILERDPLPNVCPYGDRWDQCIANRTFKTKVINLVIERLPWLLKLTGEQSLIIDYAGHPVAFRTGPDGQMQKRVLESLVPLGEADIKFSRYADLFRDLLVDSVDGDSIPIALIHHEKSMKELTNGSMEPSDLTGSPPQICIFRITTKVSDDSFKPARKKVKGANGQTQAATEAPTAVIPASKGKRTYEYVNIPLLYTCMRSVISQCFGRAQLTSHLDQYMLMLLSLIGLTGTDFTRSLPQVSGKSVYRFLPDILGPVVGCFNPEEGQLDVKAAADYIVAGIYSAKFSPHFHTPPTTIEEALHTLKISKLSDRTKGSLPAASQVTCTIRNINWLLRYWKEPETVPDPLESSAGRATYGYTRQQGMVMFADA